MPTKEQLSQELNGKLGTDMEWDKMKKDDLELMLELTETGALLEPMAKLQVQKHGKEKLDDLVDSWYPGKLATKVV